MQFSCLSVDNSGEVVCAGSLDTFEIFVWCMKTGRLIEVYLHFYLVILFCRCQLLSTKPIHNALKPDQMSRGLCALLFNKSVRSEIKVKGKLIKFLRSLLGGRKHEITHANVDVE